MNKPGSSQRGRLKAWGTVFAWAACALAALHASVAQAAPFTPAQLKEVQHRWTLAEQLVAQLEPQAKAMGLSPSWRQSTMQLLLANSATRLSELARLGSYAAVVSGAAPVRASGTTKLLGDASNDLVYKPFNPCRYMDTRNVGGKISGIRTFDLANTGNSYGGDPACDPKTLAGISNEDQIGALAVNIAIVDTSAGAPGFLTMRPAGSTRLTALANWYVASASAQDSNAAIVTIDQTAQAAEFEIMTSSPVHVIVDLLGVFISPSATPLDCTTLQVNTLNVAPGGTGAPFATCPAGYAVTGGGCHYYNLDGTGATENTVFINKDTQRYDTVTQTFLNAWSCFLSNQDPVKTFNVGVRVRCCRIPGR